MKSAYHCSSVNRSLPCLSPSIATWHTFLGKSCAPCLNTQRRLRKTLIRLSDFSQVTSYSAMSNSVPPTVRSYARWLAPSPP